MARIFIDSFETQNLNLWDTVGSSTVVPTSGLSMKGDYCLCVSSNVYKYIDCTNNYYAFRFRIGSGDPYNVLTLRVGASNSGGINYHLTNKCFAFWRQGQGIVKYGISNTIYANITYFIQIYYYHSSSSGYIIIKVNDTIILEFNGSTQGCSGVSNNFYLSGPCYYDNFIIDDSSMPEETEIIILKPNGIGAFSDWNPTTSGGNYSCVDEVPYNDSDYVASGIVNAVDTYTLEDMPSNAKDVKCVQAQSRARKDSDSTATRFNFVMREGTTNYDSDAFLLSNTFDDYYTMYSDGPTGSGFWYIPDMNNMEVGVKVRT